MFWFNFAYRNWCSDTWHHVMSRVFFAISSMQRSYMEPLPCVNSAETSKKSVPILLKRTWNEWPQLLGSYRNCSFACLTIRCLTNIIYPSRGKSFVSMLIVLNSQKATVTDMKMALGIHPFFWTWIHLAEAGPTYYLPFPWIRAYARYVCILLSNSMTHSDGSHGTRQVKEVKIDLITPLSLSSGIRGLNSNNLN